MTRASPATRLRRSRTLLAWPRGARLVVSNYLLGTSVDLGAPALVLLGGRARWTTRADLARLLRREGVARPEPALAALVCAGILVPERSLLVRYEAAWLRRWRWGPLAAAFHRSLRDVRFRTLEDTQAILARRNRTRPAPPVLPPDDGPRTPLPPPRTRRGVLPHLLRRRSTWDLSGAPIGRRDLADVLFAGLGVRGLLHDPVQGTLPLKLAPSGGARNPIDGYVLALRVAGLAAGVYRYSGLRRDLERVAGPPAETARALLGGQPWAEGAAAVVFLVASFGRSMWKYEHPLSYRMVLLEAGHVAQNVLVAACDLGLACFPSGALSDSLCEAALDLRGIDRAVLYAVAIGREARPQRARRARSARNSTTSGSPGSASAQ